MNECAELRVAIARLEGKINALSKINEQSIIEKAVKQAAQAIRPEIVAVGFVATGAAAKAAEATARASGVAARLAGLAARLAPIFLALASLGTAAATVKLLEARSDGLENYIDTVSRDLSKLYGTVSKHDAAIKHIRGTANNALIKADRALGKFPGIESSIADIKAAVKHIRGTANDALIVARRAMTKFPSLEETIEHIRGTANDGLIVARRAEAAIDSLRQEIKNITGTLNTRLDEFELGVRFLHDDLSSRLRLAVIYFTESITGMSKSMYKTLDIHSREIYRFNNEIASLSSRIQYIINFFVPTYVRTAIPSLTGTVESIQTKLNNLTSTVINLTNNIANFPAIINTVTSSNPIIQNLTQQVKNVTNNYGGDVINNANSIVNNAINNINSVVNNAVTNLNSRVGILENQLKNNERMNEQANSSLDGLKLLVLALPTTLANNQTFQNAAVNAAATGSCKSLSGGCSGSPLPKMQNDLVGANTKIDLLLQGGQTALLAKIDKTTTGISGALGTQIPLGGIGAGLSRFMSSSIVDRTLNLVSVAASIHNAMMLSNSIQETLFSSLDNLIAIPSLIKNPDGETIDTKEIFTKHLDSYFAKLFGATEWAAIKAQWKSYSTIYSSSANGWDNARSILNDSQELMNQGRNFTAELGNAMADEGLISEENWKYKDSNKKIKSKNLDKLNRMGQGLENLDNGLQAIEQVTSTLRSIAETANEIKENIAAVDKAIDEANTDAKKDRDAKEEGLDLPNFSLEDLF